METAEKATKTLSVEARIACALAAAMLPLCLLWVLRGAAIGTIYEYSDPRWLSDFFTRGMILCLVPVLALSLVCLTLALLRPAELGRWFPVRSGTFFGVLAVSPYVMCQGIGILRCFETESPKEPLMLLTLSLWPPAACLVWALARNRATWRMGVLAVLAFLAIPVSIFALLAWPYLPSLADWAFMVSFCTPLWTCSAFASLWVWLIRRVPPRPARAWVKAFIVAAWLAVLAVPFVYAAVNITRAP